MRNKIEEILHEAQEYEEVWSKPVVDKILQKIKEARDMGYEEGARNQALLDAEQIKETEAEGKKYIGKIKREWYQKGYKEAEERVIEEVRGALWKKAKYLYSIGLDDMTPKKESVKHVGFTGNEIDKFIDKLKNPK